MAIQISENRRFLMREDGSPFFYLGDTAWELFHRCNREEADAYLRNRAAKDFTVIQAVALAEHLFEEPNPYGDHPLQENDPTRPNEPYFQHVDYVVDRAAELGLTVGLLPTWGDKWNRKWGGGPELFTPENAFVYGEFLGKRYAERPILWILGGDRPVENETHRAIIRAMAAGLTQGDGGRHLQTFHPMGKQTSAQYFHAEDWLDFNMIQSGHTRDQDNYRMVADDYARTPTKPCMDAEPGYEDHPNGFKPENGYLTDYDTRKSAYWALFAGAHGHTYGCHDIWQFWQPGRTPISAARTDWREAMDLPGAGQMQFARRLIESRLFFTRIPDSTLLLSPTGEGGEHIAVTRCAEGSYAFAYLPTGQAVEIDLDRLAGDRITGTWYNPRTGETHACGEFTGAGRREFAPPTQGAKNDWVLILDDAAREFPLPGAAK